MEDGAGMVRFQRKLIRLKSRLRLWNNEVFGNLFQRVKEAEEEVAHLERVSDSTGSVRDRNRCSEARAKLKQALLCEEIFLRQQSSVRWIREGDDNTRFFHAMIRKKSHLAHIHRIKESDSSWITDPSEIATSAVNYFQGIRAGRVCHMQDAAF